MLASLAALAPVAAARADEQQAAGVASSRMSYSRFLEYLDMGRVKKVRPHGARMTPHGACMQPACSPAGAPGRSLVASGRSGARLPEAERPAATPPRSASHSAPPHPTLGQVDLYENGTIAIVEAVSPELGNRVQRVRVQLPGTSAELLNKMREKKVDFAAHSNTEDSGSVFLNLLGAWSWGEGRPGWGPAGVFWKGAPALPAPRGKPRNWVQPAPARAPTKPRLRPRPSVPLTRALPPWHTGNLAFPLLLVGGLFLLSRRSGGAGMGGPGGNNPMAFGR